MSSAGPIGKGGSKTLDKESTGRSSKSSGSTRKIPKAAEKELVDAIARDQAAQTPGANPGRGMENDEAIIVKNARVHNLKNISTILPRDQLTVLTGPSGSGKSSLAFDTIYAEGQRRYVESLSAYARQFLEQLGKPDVESISGLSPTISIEQRTTSYNPRSTVGTVTEIYWA